MCLYRGAQGSPVRSKMMHASALRPLLARLAAGGGGGESVFVLSKSAAGDEGGGEGGGGEGSTTGSVEISRTIEGLEVDEVTDVGLAE